METTLSDVPPATDRCPAEPEQAHRGTAIAVLAVFIVGGLGILAFAVAALAAVFGAFG